MARSHYTTEVFRHRPEARIPRHAGLLGTIDTRPVQSRKQPYDGAAFSGISRYGALHVRPRILAWLTLPVSQLTTIFIDASSDLQLVLVLLTACPCSTSDLVCDLDLRQHAVNAVQRRFSVHICAGPADHNTITAWYKHEKARCVIDSPDVKPTVTSVTTATTRHPSSVLVLTDAWGKVVF